MDLSLHISQKQILSQKMQQSVEILQMNSLALSEYLQTLAEENPLVEWHEAEVVQLSKQNKLLQKLEWLEAADEQNRSYYRIEHDDAHTREDNHGEKREEETLCEYLLFQIHILKVDKTCKAVLEFLAESLDQNGYLEVDALAAASKKYHLSLARQEEILQTLQSLDPSGVGARNLQECLTIQLQQKNASALPLILVQQHLEDIAKNKISTIAKAQHVSTKEVLQAISEIRLCEPKPARGFASNTEIAYVLPDILVEKQGEQLQVLLNSNATPTLSISHAYIKMLRNEASKETEDYIANKLRQAEWAMQCVSKREATLLATATEIVMHQKDFFLNNNGQIRPLRMGDIAKKLDLHESTISRAVKEKYIQCSRGVFAMSQFFSTALGENEETAVSANHIQQKIKALIQNENKQKPFSDRELTEFLQAEGIQISRRTVAKYRENLGIDGASNRKRYEL